MTLAAFLILLVQIVVGIGHIYYYVLLIAGGHPRRGTVTSTEPKGLLRFAVAAPAHNEEKVIGATVARLGLVDYPRDLFDVHVVADHCTDATAQIARSAGATVHERSHGLRGRKGYALAWLLERILSDTRHYDGVVVFDADSQVLPDFLGRVGAALAQGADVVQGRHMIANPEASRFSALADADMRLNNRLRNQAKENLGLSARLMGDGMCFRREILEAYPFGAQSLVEDREYGIYLVTQGARVRYVPEAVTKGEAASRWGDATGQRLRWYGGVFDLRRRYLGPLFAAAWRKRSLAALDLALELALPSYSTIVMLAIGVLAAQVVLSFAGIPFPLLPSIILVILAILYPLLGLLVERAPWHCYKALAFGPVYVAWRVWLGLAVRLHRGRVPWIRTRRAGEENTSP